MYVIGKNVLEEALKSKYQIKKILLDEKKKNDFENSILKLIKKNNVNFEFVERKIINNKTRTEKNQGICTILNDEYNYSDLNIINDINNPLILILDQIQDPHNFGAIVRSAVASGVNAIIIPKKNAVEVNATVIKVSSGQIFKIPIIKVTNISRTIDYLKKLNIWIYNAELTGKKYYDVDMTMGTCIVLGNEGSGVRDNVRKHCDDSLTIPMENEVESLNVSATAAILLFEAKKQRTNIID